MKYAYGWALPDDDIKCERYLANCPLVSGRHAYQAPHIQATLQAMRSCRVAVDIGAHVGFWSFYIAKYFAEVHAFEPVPAVAECFRENVKDKHVTLHETALGEKRGVVEMAVTADNSGLCYVKTAGRGTTAIDTLDSFKLTDVDLVKIDVEGYEQFVLKGARKTLRANKPVIVIEQKSHSERYASGQYDALGYLKAMGAQVVGRVVDDFILAWP